MRPRLNIDDYEAYRMSEFADLHDITWAAVNYLIKTGKVDSRQVGDTTYVIMTARTKRYQPNEKR